MSYLTKAIYLLAPEAEFSYQNDDYSTINWIVEPKSIPTQSEIDDAIEQVKVAEQAEAEAKATAKAAAEAKLAALGLTADDLKAIGL